MQSPRILCPYAWLPLLLLLTVVFASSACKNGEARPPFSQDAAGSYFVGAHFGAPVFDGEHWHFSRGISVWMSEDAPAIVSPAEGILQWSPEGAGGTLRLRPKLTEDEQEVLGALGLVPRFVYFSPMDPQSVTSALVAAGVDEDDVADMLATDYESGEADAVKVEVGATLGRPLPASAGDGVPSGMTRRLDGWIVDQYARYIDPMLYMRFDSAQQGPWRAFEASDTTPPQVALRLFPHRAQSLTRELPAASATGGPEGQPPLYWVDGDIDIVAEVRDTGAGVCTTGVACEPPLPANRAAIKELRIEVQDSLGRIGYGRRMPAHLCLPMVQAFDDAEDDDLAVVYHQGLLSEIAAGGGLPYSVIGASNHFERCLPFNTSDRLAIMFPESIEGSLSSPDSYVPEGRPAFDASFLEPGERYTLWVEVTDHADRKTETTVQLERQCPKGSPVVELHPTTRSGALSSRARVTLTRADGQRLAPHGYRKRYLRLCGAAEYQVEVELDGHFPLTGVLTVSDDPTEAPVFTPSVAEGISHETGSEPDLAVFDWFSAPGEYEGEPTLIHQLSLQLASSEPPSVSAPPEPPEPEVDNVRVIGFDPWGNEGDWNTSLNACYALKVWEFNLINEFIADFEALVAPWAEQRGTPFDPDADPEEFVASKTFDMAALEGLVFELRRQYLEYPDPDKPTVSPHLNPAFVAEMRRRLSEKWYTQFLREIYLYNGARDGSVRLGNPYLDYVDFPPETIEHNYDLVMILGGEVGVSAFGAVGATLRAAEMEIRYHNSLGLKWATRISCVSGGGTGSGSVQAIVLKIPVEFNVVLPAGTAANAGSSLSRSYYSPEYFGLNMVTFMEGGASVGATGGGFSKVRIGSLEFDTSGASVKVGTDLLQIKAGVEVAAGIGACNGDEEARDVVSQPVPVDQGPLPPPWSRHWIERFATYLFFPTGVSALDPNDEATLDTLVEEIVAQNNEAISGPGYIPRIEVFGSHSQLWAGQDNQNRALALARAQSVHDYLADRLASANFQLPPGTPPVYQQEISLAPPVAAPRPRNVGPDDNSQLHRAALIRVFYQPCHPSGNVLGETLHTHWPIL